MDQECHKMETVKNTLCKQHAQSLFVSDMLMDTVPMEQNLLNTS
jgi:hypothetical protein